MARAGVNLEMVFARRTPEQPGKGLLIVGPIKGAKAMKAAQAAGIARSDPIHGVRIEGTDKPGLGAESLRPFRPRRIPERSFAQRLRKFSGGNPVEL